MRHARVCPDAGGPGPCGDPRMSCSVLIVDDHAAFRSAARALLEAFHARRDRRRRGAAAGGPRPVAERGRIDVVGKVGTARELHEKIALTRPDVAIVDIRMPPTHTDEGLVATREIRESHPETGVLILSHSFEARYALKLLEQHPGRYLLRRLRSSAMAWVCRRSRANPDLAEPNSVSSCARACDGSSDLTAKRSRPLRHDSMVERYADERTRSRAVSCVQVASTTPNATGASSHESIPCARIGSVTFQVLEAIASPLELWA
jgi:DNA-binding NarL/FixJ family response regulator